MTLSIAIAIIVIADVALIAGLAYVMSHARHLTPHVPAGSASFAPASHAERAPRLVGPRSRRMGPSVPVAS
jgi:hypothetical protein